MPICERAQLERNGTDSKPQTEYKRNVFGKERKRDLDDPTNQELAEAFFEAAEDVIYGEREGTASINRGEATEEVNFNNLEQSEDSSGLKKQINEGEVKYRAKDGGVRTKVEIKGDKIFIRRLIERGEGGEYQNVLIIERDEEGVKGILPLQSNTGDRAVVSSGDRRHYGLIKEALLWSNYFPVRTGARAMSGIGTNSS